MMKPIQLGVISPAIMIFTFLAVFYPRDGACQPCEPWAAKLVSVQGLVYVRKAGETQWMPVNLNDTYCAGDMIRVNANSRAAVLLTNETLVRLDQNSTIAITGLKEEETFLLNVVKGVMHFFSRFPKRVMVMTPFVNATVEGTEFYVRIEAERTWLSIFEGQVAATNAAGSLVLASGQTAVARAGQAPALRTVVRPRDAVHWALYYPPIIDWRESDFKGGKETDWQGMVRRSISYYWKGDIANAFSALEQAPREIRDPRFFLYRAALLLTVGRVDEAQADIARALNRDPSNSHVFALQSIVAVVQNNKDQALELAKKAVDFDPTSSTARVALAYAQQARFDLENALKALEEAVKLDPDNALAYAQLAELLLSLGELDQSAEAAQRAVELNPDLARTQTILGFAFITRIQTKEAKEAFEKAIDLDSAAPLPRLGLGLAKIRAGDLKGGRAEIEIAASLDPNNSLIRSYLGKAYFDEKRNKPAQNQFEIAKKLDPLDPTPWFYDAIRKQTVNRPVEALYDLQKSIELNDNRAVFRSRLQLDQDLAARNASLGRIYDNLGFQLQGLVQGWKSVNIDPANYSAHRLLADLYAAVPRHRIARVSELLQAQLLQPINTTPIQPLLAESNVFIFENAGPTDLAMNEFNPLFLRNRFTLQPSAVVGGNNTSGDELIHSGLWNQFSYSLGQFHFETDGFRDNNDHEQDILTAFVQASLSPKTSIQGEIRYRERDFGDLDLLFDPERFSPKVRQNPQRYTYRLGLNHAFTPKSEVVASVIGQDLKERIDDQDEFGTTEIKEDTDGYLAEAQNLYHNGRLDVVSGIGYYDADFKDSFKFISAVPDIIPDSFDKRNRDINHFNGYIYTHFKILNGLTLTTGFSYDDFDDDRTDQNQINPKLGLTWSLASSTTLRLAVFRSLTRTLIADQTIEPTQVAGFNQFFDDVPGADVWTYGGAIDQKLFDNLFGGVQFYKRDLNVPFEEISLTATTSTFRDTDWQEYIGRAYLYWAPHPWLSFNTEYWYEKFERGNEFPGTEEILDLKTNRLQIGGNFFHPSGLFAGLKTTYIDQDGEFGHPKFPPTVRDGDHFWVVDASLGYRLPDRFGMLSLEVKNIFDEDFNYQDTDPANPTIFPERQILVRFTLAF